MAGSRGLTSAMLAALAGRELRPVLLFEAAFTSGSIQVFTGTGILRTSDGREWVGLPLPVEIAAISDVSKVLAQGTAFTFSGLDSSLLQKTMEEVRITGAAKAYLGLLGPDDRLIPDPQLMVSGYMDAPQIEDGGETSTIRFNVEGPFLDNRTRIRRFTHEDQQLDFPGDEAFKFRVALVHKEIVWGKAGGGAGTIGGGGGGGGGGGRGEDTCWSPESLVRTRNGPAPIESVAAGMEVRTRLGTWRRVAHGLVHEYEGPLRVVPGAGEVTPEHYLAEGKNWLPAGDLYFETIEYKGRVYNLVVEAEDFDERSYEMANGRVAHNIKVRGLR